ncbi:FAD-dependent monooxygenase [Streptomyces sp. DvalAA-19]|uniref:FAD-dependent monooxygenase n=1 Tax=Streptomyces sp. DvalAA-19 TaxID=1839761 RepID=UPI00081B4A38|nr:FAD-dependent monooxygenase [Streptomyces sp. DvalAA-19]SCD82401.1 2-polyprenyl-6-methoxyphenol hydroxylase [Streptomyces sp. DvalAA-19]
MGVRHAVVAGGGIGGLTAAVALSRRGWRVTVCERALVLTGIGAGIVLAPNALRALDSIGLGAAVSKGEPLAGALGLRTPDGAWLSRTGATASRYGLPARAVHRGFLIDALAAALPPDALRLGVPVSGVDDRGDEVVVRTPEGELRADAVVAADGLRSVLRGQLFPRHPGPRYAGETGWRAVLSGTGLPALSAAETWGRGERFGIVPLVDGRVYVYATAVTGPGTRPADHLAELVRRFGAWHDPIPALLERLEQSDRNGPDRVRILHHDFHELAAPLPRFHSGRVALLGDAAHAMTPNLGQGGCQAIEDAVVLAHLLAGDTDVPAALAAYTEARHGRTTRISRRSRRMGDLARLSRPLAVSVRNFAVRATPSAVTRRGLDTLLAWQPPPGPASATGSGPSAGSAPVAGSAPAPPDPAAGSASHSAPAPTPHSSVDIEEQQP